MTNKIFKSKIGSVLWQFIYTLLVLLGLPLLGWGINALPAFFMDPFRVTFSIVVLVQALINTWLEAISPPQPYHEHHFDLPRWHGSMYEIIAVLSAFGDRHGILAWSQNDSVRWIGLVIYLIGAALAIWSDLAWIKHLGTEAARTLDRPILITEGPYKWIRHPPLLRLIFYSLGYALMFRSWIGLALMLPLLAGTVNRINGLEKVLAEEYQKIWLWRCQKSKKLIPYLY